MKGFSCHYRVSNIFEKTWSKTIPTIEYIVRDDAFKPEYTFVKL